MLTSTHSKDSFWEIKVFLIVVGFYLLFLLGTLIIFGYQDSFLLLNSGHQSWLDQTMFVLTHFGDSLILSSILILLLLRKSPEVVLTTIALIIITGIAGQLLKVLFFDEWDRPLRVFNESPLVYVLPKYRLFHNSFPSGHSITISAAVTALVLGLKPAKMTQIVAGMLVAIISFTRIYLGVHFPGDVLVGCILGMCMTIILNPYLIRFFSTFNYSKSFLVILTCISICTLFTGVWFLKGYFLS